ncbi:hypothetical protein BC834DRAFT_844367 [Gloeopeniophorella convolvens]|nr:hypothetical protein BC834DRAFT_844367 [Gloeopeniophorella convolvens]
MMVVVDRSHVEIVKRICIAPGSQGIFTAKMASRQGPQRPQQVMALDTKRQKTAQPPFRVDGFAVAQTQHWFSRATAYLKLGMMIGEADGQNGPLLSTYVREPLRKFSYGSDLLQRVQPTQRSVQVGTSWHASIARFQIPVSCQAELVSSTPPRYKGPGIGDQVPQLLLTFVFSRVLVESLFALHPPSIFRPIRPLFEMHSSATLAVLLFAASATSPVFAAPYSAPKVEARSELDARAVDLKALKNIFAPLAIGILGGAAGPLLNKFAGNGDQQQSRDFEDISVPDAIRLLQLAAPFNARDFEERSFIGSLLGATEKPLVDVLKEGAAGGLATGAVVAAGHGLEKLFGGNDNNRRDVTPEQLAAVLLLAARSIDELD